MGVEEAGMGDGRGEVLDKNSEFQTSLFPVDSTSEDLKWSLKFCCCFLKSSPGGFYAKSVSEMLTSHLFQYLFAVSTEVCKYQD